MAKPKTQPELPTNTPAPEPESEQGALPLPEHPNDAAARVSSETLRVDWKTATDAMVIAEDTLAKAKAQ